MQRQYFLMLERAPGYFWVERFMVEQNLILFYPWCYYATQKYHVMRRGICRTYVRHGTKSDGGNEDNNSNSGGGVSGGDGGAAVTAMAVTAAAWRWRR
jgi:hypothetical protein